MMQWKNQTLWNPILAFKPQAWLWMGDAVYVKEEEGKTLRDAYRRQLEQPGMYVSLPRIISLPSLTDALSSYVS